MSESTEKGNNGLEISISKLKNVIDGMIIYVDKPRNETIGNNKDLHDGITREIKTQSDAHL